MKYELNHFYNCDCMEAMEEIPDKFFDLAICDPQYGIGESGSKNHSRSNLAKAKDYKDYHGNDEKPPEKEYFDELFRISKNQIIWGANHYISRMPYDSSCWLIWDKENGSNDFADCELAWTSFKTAVRIFRYRWQGMLQGNMKDKEIRIHPNQKPVVLYDWQLKQFAKPGFKLLDTHVGSASSLISFYNNGFDYMGFEVDKYYYNLGNERLEAVKSQMRFF